MKLLLASAATALALSTPAFAQTQSNALSSYELTESDFYASDFIGMRVYSSEADFGDTATVAGSSAAEWDDIGEINDLIISADGDVELVIVGVGGFLGLGEKDVALDMSGIRVLTEDTNPDNRFLVVNASAEMLENAPAFEGNDPMADETAMTETDDAMVEEQNTEMAADTAVEGDMATTGQTETEMADGEPMVERPRLSAPLFEQDGYTMVERDQLTSEELTGMRVYGVNGEDVGEVNSIVMTDDGQVDQLILDIGGFIGLGEHQIAVTPEELTFARDESTGLNIYIDATQETLEAQPEYQG